MKQLYAFVLASLFVGNVVAGEGDIVRSLTMYNLTTEKLNESYTDSQNNQIIFTTHEPTNTVSGSEWKTMIYSESSALAPLECIGETISETAPYDVVTLRGRSNFSVAQSPYILIELPAKHNIVDVEVLGRAAGGAAGAKAQLICAFSTSGTKDSDFGVDPSNWDPDLSYTQDACPERSKQALLDGTKYIKLISNKSYAGVAIGFDANPMIFAINLYAKDTGTGIGEEDATALDIQLYGRNLQLNELADVVIYDITGKLVAQYANVEDAYLDSLNGGVYVVKATNKNGQIATQKVVIK